MSLLPHKTRTKAAEERQCPMNQQSETEYFEGSGLQHHTQRRRPVKVLVDTTQGIDASGFYDRILERASDAEHMRRHAIETLIGKWKMGERQRCSQHDLQKAGAYKHGPAHTIREGSVMVHRKVLGAVILS